MRQQQIKGWFLFHMVNKVQILNSQFITMRNLYPISSMETDHRPTHFIQFYMREDANCVRKCYPGRKLKVRLIPPADVRFD